MNDVMSRGDRAGRQARHSTTMRAAAKIGLVAYGVVHLLIAVIAIQLAWDTTSDDASTSGALKTIAEQPFGGTMLWVCAFGLLALTLWQLLTAMWGFQDVDSGLKRLGKRFAAVFRAIVYAVLGFSAARIAAGSSTSKNSDSKEEGLTADLLSAPAGRLLVAAVGITIIVVAIVMIVRAFLEKFTKELDASATSGTSGTAIVTLGKIGHIGKAVSIGIVGILFGWAAISYDPDKAGGLDDALQTVRDQPFGPYLLTLVAIGLAAFGLFCFAWAKHVKAR